MTSLEDLRPWYDSVPVGDTPIAVSRLREWFDAVAADCEPTDCGNTGDTAAVHIECEVTTCVTAAGDVVAIVSSTATDLNFMALSTAYTSERRVATTPSGQRVELVGDTDEEWWEGHYAEMTATWTATWSGGAPISGWPEDGSFEAAAGEYSDYFGFSSAAGGWSTTGCVLSAGTMTGLESVSWVDVGGHSGLVEDAVDGCSYNPGWFGAFDGVDVGRVDPSTWASAGDDLDHDGFATEDCDDADPDVNPCAVEVLDDGIDQDCDGADATSFSDTGDVEPMPRAFTERSAERPAGCAGLLVWLGLLPLVGRWR